MGIYICVYVSYSVTLAFYAASFPRLARNTRHIRELQEMYEQGKIPVDVYEQEEGLERSKISSLSMARILLCSPFTVDNDNILFQASGSIGIVTIPLLALSLLIPLQHNAKVNNYSILMWVYLTVDIVSGVRLFIILKGDRIWSSDRYLVVCVMTFSLYFGWNTQRPHNHIRQLYSNNRVLAQNYLGENTTSQLAGNRSVPEQLAL